MSLILVVVVVVVVVVVRGRGPPCLDTRKLRLTLHLLSPFITCIYPRTQDDPHTVLQAPLPCSYRTDVHYPHPFQPPPPLHMTGSGSARPHLGHARSASGTSFVSIAPKTINKLLLPLSILLTIVLASAGQTEVAHYLSANIGYHQPYFTFFLTHITFALVFPLHLLCLFLFHRRPVHYYLEGLRHIIAEQLGDSTSTWRQVAPKWSAKVTWLTTLISVPALSWFVAMNLTTGLAVTTIYATSAFWTYLFSMVLLKQPLSRITVGSIALAFAGVIVLSLDGLKGETTGAPNPLLGDIIMMFGKSMCSVRTSHVAIQTDQLRCPCVGAI